MHASSQVANKFLALAQAEGRPLTPMQIIKLVYIAHGWMLGLHGRELIRDEVQAWKFGPVIPELYRAVGMYRGDPISGRLSEPPSPPFDEIENDLLEQVYRKYGGRSGGALSHLTHQPDTPWAKTWDPNGWALPIPNELIRAHYSEMARRYGAQNG